MKAWLVVVFDNSNRECLRSKIVTAESQSAVIQCGKEHGISFPSRYAKSHLETVSISDQPADSPAAGLQAQKVNKDFDKLSEERSFIRLKERIVA